MGKINFLKILLVFRYFCLLALIPLGVRNAFPSIQIFSYFFSWFLETSMALLWWICAIISYIGIIRFRFKGWMMFMSMSVINLICSVYAVLPIMKKELLIYSGNQEAVLYAGRLITLYVFYLVFFLIPRVRKSFV